MNCGNVNSMGPYPTGLIIFACSLPPQSSTLSHESSEGQCGIPPHCLIIDVWRQVMEGFSQFLATRKGKVSRAMDQRYFGMKFAIINNHSAAWIPRMSCGVCALTENLYVDILDRLDAMVNSPEILRTLISGKPACVLKKMVASAYYSDFRCESCQLRQASPITIALS